MLWVEAAGPMVYTLKRQGFDPDEITLTGKELYRTLTGKQDDHLKLMSLTGRVAQETLQNTRYIDLIESKVKDIAEGFKRKYKTVDDLLLDIF